MVIKQTRTQGLSSNVHSAPWAWTGTDMVLGSNPRSGRIFVRIISARALSLFYRTCKRIDSVLYNLLSLVVIKLVAYKCYWAAFIKIKAGVMHPWTSFKPCCGPWHVELNFACVTDGGGLMTNANGKGTCGHKICHSQSNLSIIYTSSHHTYIKHHL